MCAISPKERIICIRLKWEGMGMYVYEWAWGWEHLHLLSSHSRYAHRTAARQSGCRMSPMAELRLSGAEELHLMQQQGAPGCALGRASTAHARLCKRFCWILLHEGICATRPLCSALPSPWESRVSPCLVCLCFKIILSLRRQLIYFNSTSNLCLISFHIQVSHLALMNCNCF